ncbi:MAG: PASTA domain-containing protein [Coriobacteriia bacterium]
MTESEITSDFFESGLGDGASLLDRPRRRRPSFIPRWLPIALGVSLVVIVVAVAGVWYANSISLVAVPKVVGYELTVAQSRAGVGRFGVVVVERRFSVIPAGTIIEQSPAAGSKLRRGKAISVVLSGGTEEFAMPDVTGSGLLQARGLLERKGLEVRVETESSDQPSGTVLATNPSPGVMIRTGEIVHLTAASQGPGSSTLLPLNLQGVAITIDPAVVPQGQTDVSLEVARKLRSLIEASGGTVLVTRSLTDSGTAASVAVRARRAQVSSTTVAVGIDVAQNGQKGLAALYPLTGPTAILEPSRTLATAVATALLKGALSASASTTQTDTVLMATKAPWSRVQLGSASAPEDVRNFSDSRWGDDVARAIYRAIAEIYGVKGAAN